MQQTQLFERHIFRDFIIISLYSWLNIVYCSLFNCFTRLESNYCQTQSDLRKTGIKCYFQGFFWYFSSKLATIIRQSHKNNNHVIKKSLMSENVTSERERSHLSISFRDFIVILAASCNTYQIATQQQKFNQEILKVNV